MSGAVVNPPLKLSAAEDTNNHPIANEAGVEIIPIDTEGSNDVDAAAGSPNVDFNVVDVDVVPPAKSWPTKEAFIVMGALCVVGGGSYLLAESHATASNKMMNFGSSQQQQMQQTAKKGGYEFEQVGDPSGLGVCCADSCGNGYPYIEYFDVSSSEKCGEKCSECPGKKQGGLVLRGFDYDAPNTLCKCLVDFGIEFDDTVCEGVNFVNDYSEGRGEVEMAVQTNCGRGRGDYQCWKVSSKGSKVKSRNCGGTKAPRKPKSSKQPTIRKLGQKDDSLSNVERKTDSHTIRE